MCLSAHSSYLPTMATVPSKKEENPTSPSPQPEGTPLVHAAMPTGAPPPAPMVAPASGCRMSRYLRSRAAPCHWTLYLCDNTCIEAAACEIVRRASDREPGFVPNCCKHVLKAVAAELRGVEPERRLSVASTLAAVFCRENVLGLEHMAPFIDPDSRLEKFGAAVNTAINRNRPSAAGDLVASPLWLEMCRAPPVLLRLLHGMNMAPGNLYHAAVVARQMDLAGSMLPGVLEVASCHCGGSSMGGCDCRGLFRTTKLLNREQVSALMRGRIRLTFGDFRFLLSDWERGLGGDSITVLEFPQQDSAPLSLIKQYTGNGSVLDSRLRRFVGLLEAAIRLSPLRLAWISAVVRTPRRPGASAMPFPA